MMGNKYARFDRRSWCMKFFQRETYLLGEEVQFKSLISHVNFKSTGKIMQTILALYLRTETDTYT